MDSLISILVFADCEQLCLSTDTDDGTYKNGCGRAPAKLYLQAQIWLHPPG